MKTKIFYRRYLGDYEGWTLHIWRADNGHYREIAPTEKNDFGLVFETELDGAEFGVIPKFGNWQNKDAPNRFFSADNNEIYIIEGKPEVYFSPPKNLHLIRKALLDSPSQIRLILDKFADKKLTSTAPIIIQTPCGVFQPASFSFYPSDDNFNVLTLNFPPCPGIDLKQVNEGHWSVQIAGLAPKTVFAGRIQDDKYFRSNRDLGVSVNNGKTTFRVFAPAARFAVLLLKKHKNDEPAERAMDYFAHGLWETSFEADLTGHYYRYRVNAFGKTKEGLDPYSKLNTSYDGWGVIGGDNTPVAPLNNFSNSENIIYELHIRDFTIDPENGIKLKGKYLGICEDGAKHTDYKDITTSLDHLAELGVNAVHILPFNEFEKTTADGYGWGYMPVHFNSPEISYAQKSEAAIQELKTLIDALHKRNIKAIMDVVFNHTAENNAEKIYSFNALAPDYYYRTLPDGTYTDGAGCGNEFRTEAPMARKFILDTLKYWTSEYKIDGFRFDLMALLDKETLTQILTELKQINPHIFIYGEPWAGFGGEVKSVSKGYQRSKGFAVFNDNFRDALCGDVFNLSQGYIQSGARKDAVKKGILGSIDDFCDSPLESINYVSCHDGYTLHDRVSLTAKTADMQVKKDIAFLANAVVLTSQGIPFILSGEEMLRSKNNCRNSYNRPDEINMIKWRLKKLNADIFAGYQTLIDIRKKHPAFRLKSRELIKKAVKFYEDANLKLEGNCIGYIIDGEIVGDSWKKIIVLINPHREKKTFQLPEGAFSVAFAKRQAQSVPAPIISSAFTAEQISLNILHQ